VRAGRRTAKPGQGAEVSLSLATIDVITLFVEDLADSKRFYQRVFGLPVAFEDENSAVFKFDNTTIAVISGRSRMVWQRQ
jgi:catechol-2,3-dioxygenase